MFCVSLLSAHSVLTWCCFFVAAVTTFFPEGSLKFHLIDSNLNALQLRILNFTFHLSDRLDVEERAAAPSTCLTEELRRLRAEEQEKQLQLEESHRQEVEHLRAHYQQQATETEERYLTELFMLQQRLQEVTGTQTHFRWRPQIPHVSTYGINSYVFRPKQSKHTANCPYICNDKGLYFYRWNVKHREPLWWHIDI